MKEINAGNEPVHVHEWDCGDAGSIAALWNGMCKGVVFKSIPNADQFFVVRIREEDGRTQQWELNPSYQGQRIVFDHPCFVSIDVVTKTALLVSWRTVIIILDEIVTSMDFHDPAEMIWDPLVRNLVLPLGGTWSDPVYYYPLRSGHLRIRTLTDGTNTEYIMFSQCETSGQTFYMMTGSVRTGANHESFPKGANISTSSGFLPYLTQGLRYKLIFHQDEGLLDKLVNADLATIHGGFAQ